MRQLSALAAHWLPPIGTSVPTNDRNAIDKCISIYDGLPFSPFAGSGLAITAAPHHFPSVVSGDTPPILVIGAGLSFPDIRTADITRRLRAALSGYGVATPGNCSPCPSGKSPTDPDCLFCLADVYLSNVQSTAAKHQRIALAEDMGIFAGEQWNGETDLPLSRNHPRHRVIARLAADQRLHAVVSLNWDCFLEAAFDAIGLMAGDPAPDRPGKMGGYAAITSNADQALAAQPRLFKIMKPHGCRRKLGRQRELQPSAEPILVVTTADISQVQTKNSHIIDEIRNALKGRPLIAAGWRAAEPYLRNVAKSVESELPSQGEDRLSIVAKSYEPELKELAEIYSSDEGSALFAVGSDVDTNHLFRWVYARFAVTKLCNLAEYPTVLTQLLVDMPRPAPEHEPIYDFVDDFLPTWNRLCAYLGGIPFSEDVMASNIPLVPRDWHIPFETYGQGNGALNRPDLAAAAQLLCRLLETGTLRNYSFSTFPGGLWQESDCRLTIAVPNFGEIGESAVLNAFPRLRREASWSGVLSRVRNVQLLSLGPSKSSSPSPAATTERLRYFSTGLSRMFPTSRFAALEEQGDGGLPFPVISVDDL